MSKIYYKEEQRFRQWWLWLLLLLVCGIWVWQFVQQIFLKVPFGNNPAPDIAVYLTGIFPLLVIILFRFMILETVVKDTGVYYRFKPFQRKPREIKQEDIAAFEVKKYRPLKDFGGWGIRYGLKGKAYNVSGDQGLFFKLNNGKKFMLGTQNPVSIKAAMDKLMKKQEV